MAAILPTDLFPGYEVVSAAGAVAADSIVIPLADLAELTAAEADAVTGDGAQLMRALDVAILAAIEGTAEVDRPTNAVITTFEERTGTFSRVRSITKTYQEAAPSNSFDLVAEA